MITSTSTGTTITENTGTAIADTWKSDAFGVVYVDDYIVVVDKAPGISVIPERWEPNEKNLLTLVRETYPEAVNAHRIDKETSGLVLFARDAESASRLFAAFESRTVGKVYRALLAGRPAWDYMECRSALALDEDRSHRSVVVPDRHPRAKQAFSAFRVLERYRGFALVEVAIETGRTHQIRAHAASLGLPVVGDPLYGGPATLRLSEFKRGYRAGKDGERALLERVALHAWSISFVHPHDGAAMSFEAPFPRDLRAAISQLSKYGR